MPPPPATATALVALLLFVSLTLASGDVGLAVSPTTLTRSNRTVTINWWGVPSPTDLDFVGIYSPANSRPDHFIGYFYLNSSSTYRAGYGSVSLPLANLRSDYEFRLFRWSADEIIERHHDHDGNPLPITRHLLARSQQVRFASGQGPEQLHLSFADGIDEMRVMFVTAEKEDGFVKYGLREGELNMTAKSTVRRYEKTDMCEVPANHSMGWRDPGWIHDALMTGLEKGRRYYYKVGSDLGGWSSVKSFISRDIDANETTAFLFGDMGTYAPYRTYHRTQEESRLTVKWILREIAALGDKPAFVSHIGDISYARGYSWIWDEFFSQIEPIASNVPYHVCIGNHEYDWPLQPWRPYWSYPIYNNDGGGECGVPYSLRFRMPGDSSFPTRNGGQDTRNLYYSFDAGVVHFLYMSTETNFLLGSDQYNFIKTDLENFNRTRTPFVVVQGHRPMYTTSNQDRDAPLQDRMLQHLEPLLVQNNVTLALWAHVHRYERFCPMKNFQCVEMSSSFKYGGAPVHVVIGMGGQDWQPIWEPRPDHRDQPIFPQPGRSMFRGGQFGYTKLVATREKLTLLYIGNHDGQVHDQVEIFSGEAMEPSNVTASKEPPASNATTFAKVVTANGTSGGEVLPKNPDVKPVAMLKDLWYVKGVAVVLLGLLLGFALGYLTRRRRDAAQQHKWTPVKSEEVTTEE